MAAKFDFAGRVALVTGGTSGVGFEIAKRLAQSGATVVVNGRSAERAEQAVVELKQFGGQAAAALGDASSYSDLTRMVEQARALGGHLDLLISAGGSGGIGPMPFADMTPDQIEEAVRLRFLPRILPVHAALAALREQGGAVVMLTTDAARHATPGESIVGAVGAGVIMMTKVLAKEFTRYGIRVNSVALTLTSDTPSWDRIFANESFQRSLFAKAVERFPMGRPPNAGEVADVAVFLASDDAMQVTGQTVSANGGLSFGGW